MEGIPEPKFSKEKFDALYRRYTESDHFFSEKAEAQARYLREKYPDFQSYAFYHILGGSGINEEIESIAHEDFPGEDSVERFIDNLVAEG